MIFCQQVAFVATEGVLVFVTTVACRTTRVIFCEVHCKLMTCLECESAKVAGC